VGTGRFAVADVVALASKVPPGRFDFQGFCDPWRSLLVPIGIRNRTHMYRNSEYL